MAAIESNVQTRYYFIGKNSKLPSTWKIVTPLCHNGIVNDWNKLTTSKGGHSCLEIFGSGWTVLFDFATFSKVLAKWQAT